LKGAGGIPPLAFYMKDLPEMGRGASSCSFDEVLVEGKGDLISSLFVKRAGGDLACPEPVEGKTPSPREGKGLMLLQGVNDYHQFGSKARGG